MRNKCLVCGLLVLLQIGVWGGWVGAGETKKNQKGHESGSSTIAKIRRAEQAADHFIERWHETLDLNVLFDELYTSNSLYRTVNARLYCLTYAFLTGQSLDCGPIADKLDEATMLRAHFAYWNMVYMQNEVYAAYPESEDRSEQIREKLKRELQNSFENPFKDWHSQPISDQTNKFIKYSEAANAIIRGYLPKKIFSSRTYLRSYRESIRKSPKPEIMQGWDEWEIDKSVTVYHIERGEFDLYFIEDGGELKVLTIGFEL